MAIDILLDEVTDGTLTGNGAFDRIMGAINAHVENQYKSKRINKTDFAEVYLGSLQYAIAEAFKFTLQQYSIESAVALQTAEISKIEFDKDLIAANISLTNCKTVQCGEQTKQIIEQTKISQWQAASEKAKTDASDVKIGSLMAEQIKKAQADVKIAQSQYSAPGTGPGQVPEGSYLGAKTKLAQAQANASLAEYDPVAAGVQDDSLLGCKKDLACAQALSESANTTNIGGGSSDISPNSMLGYKSTLLKYQSDAERAKTDGSYIQGNSLLHAQIEKMEADAETAKANYTAIGNGANEIDPSSYLGARALSEIADANNKLAQYDPISAGVAPGSLISCKTDLACAQARSERANTTSIGSGGISPTSLFGYKAELLRYQAATERANVDDSNISAGSYMQAKIDKMEADAITAQANYSSIGGTNSIVAEDSLLGARAGLLLAQARAERYKTEEIGTNGLSELSIMGAEYKLSSAKGNLMLAEYDPVAAGVQTDSIMAEKALLIKEQIISESRTTRTIGSGTGEITEVSLTGAEYLLKTAQAASEGANLLSISSGDLSSDSLMGSKVMSSIADANSKLAAYDPSAAGVMSGSTIACEAKYKCAQAEAEIAKTQAASVDIGGGNMSLGLDPTSSMGVQVELTKAQIKSEEAKLLSTTVSDGAGGTIGGTIPGTSSMGARTNLLWAQAQSEEGREAMIKQQEYTEYMKTHDAIGGTMKAQQDLYAAQKSSFLVEIKAKKAKLYADLYAVDKTQAYTSTSTLPHTSVMTAIDAVTI